MNFKLLEDQLKVFPIDSPEQWAKSDKAHRIATIFLAQHARPLSERVRVLAKELLLHEMIALETEHRPEAQEPLESDISFALWHAIQTGAKKIPEETVAKIKQLSEEAGGWWVRDQEEAVFLSPELWEATYQAWLEQKERRV